MFSPSVRHPRAVRLIIGGTLYSTGALVSILTSSLAVVTSGRIIYGLGIALSMHSAPVYISEMAPASVRGLLIALKEGFIVGGILCGFAATAIGEAVVAKSQVYRVVWLPACAIGLVVVVGMTFMPPSPRWLILRGVSRGGGGGLASTAVLPVETLPDGRSSGPSVSPSSRAAAMASLRRFRRGVPEAAVEAEVAEIEKTMLEATEISESAESGGAWQGLLRARRALTAGLGLVALQQLTGQPSVLYFQESIFIDAGFADLAASASIIVGAATAYSTATIPRSNGGHKSGPVGDGKATEKSNKASTAGGNLK